MKSGEEEEGGGMAAERKVDGCPFSWRPQEKGRGQGRGGGERKRPSRIPISTKYEIRKIFFRGGRDLRGNAISRSFCLAHFPPFEASLPLSVHFF